MPELISTMSTKHISLVWYCIENCRRSLAAHPSAIVFAIPGLACLPLSISPLLTALKHFQISMQLVEFEETPSNPSPSSQRFRARFQRLEKRCFVC